MASSNELVTIKQVDDDILKVYNEEPHDPFLDKAENTLLKIGNLEEYAKAVNKFTDARERGMVPKELLRLVRGLVAEAVKKEEEEERRAREKVEKEAAAE